VAATLEIAEYRGRDRHVLRYKREAPAFGHVVLHELAKLHFITEARKTGANKLFTTRPEHRGAFMRDIEDDLRRLQGGFSATQAEGYADSVFEGLALQIYSAPVDLLIEDYLYDEHPDLRPVQFLSLIRIHSTGIAAVTDKEVQEHAPKSVLEASTVYNLVQAYHLADRYGVDLAGRMRNTSAGRKALELYRDYEASRTAHEPGQEYDLVQEWGERLGLAGYFDLIDEGDSPRTPAPQSRSAGVRASMAEEPPQEEDSSGGESRGTSTVSHCLEALRFYQDRSRDEIQAVAFEIATLGMSGLHPDEHEKKYELRSAPGRRFSAPELLAMMYVGFETLEPGLSTGLDYRADYEKAKRIFEEKG